MNIQHLGETGFKQNPGSLQLSHVHCGNLKIGSGSHGRFARCRRPMMCLYVMRKCGTCRALKPRDTIVCWYLQGIIIPGPLRWCRISSIHSSFNTPETDAPPLLPRKLAWTLQENCAAGWNPELQIEALEKGVGVTSEDRELARSVTRLKGNLQERLSFSCIGRPRRIQRLVQTWSYLRALRVFFKVHKEMMRTKATQSARSVTKQR